MLKRIIMRSVFLLLLLVTYINANDKGVTPSTMNIPNEYTVNVGEQYRVYFNVGENETTSYYYSNPDGSLKSGFDIRITTINGTKKLNTYDRKYWYLDFTSTEIGRVFHTFQIYRSNYSDSLGSFNSLGGITIIVSKPLIPPVPRLKLQNNSIDISWDSVSGATQYQLARSTSPNGSYTRLSCSSLRNYSDSKDDLIIGQTYYYKVKAGPSKSNCYSDAYWSNYSAYKSIKLSTNSSKSITNSIFDGAGSLVSPKEDCYGCNQDIATMHPHSGVSSTVVFQWYYDSADCKEIDILAEKRVNAVIKAKSWNNHLTQKAFKTTLGASPVTLKRPDGANNWTTLAITSTEPLNSSINIMAKCKGYDEPFYIGDDTISAKKDLVEVKDNYFWTGTGSIITRATRRGSDAYGIDKDLAVTFKTKDSLTSFQWYATSNCNKLKISDKNGKNATVNELKIKGWSETSWSSNKCSSLPCTITAPSINAYYIIKIKSSPDAIKSGYLQTECIQ